MEITQIKSRLNLQTVLLHYHLKPDRNNRLQCPWHNDKTPSLQVYPDTNTWTCFSSNCNAGSGDQIEMIQRMEKCTKHEALNKAKELLGITTPVPLNKIAVLTKYYQNAIHAMQRSKKGKAYAASRKLDYNKLHMAYCGYEVGKTWNKNLKEHAEKLGLFKIKNCIIFPTKNKDGKIVSIYGRSVSTNSKIRHFYLTGGFKGLYPHYPKSETTKLILTESIIDAASVAGLANITEGFSILALYGTNGFTKEHTEAVSQLKDLEEVILFFDGDEAGKAANEKYHKQLKELNPNVKISYVDTPKGEDANSLAQAHEPEVLSHLIDNRLYFSTEKQTVPKPKSEQVKLNTDNPELILYETDLLHITILGGIKITGLDRLRVTLKIDKREYTHHLPVRHSFDLYHSKQVEAIVQKMAERLEIGTTQSERTISQLTGALENYRQSKLELLKPKKVETKTMTEAERAEAVKYLKSKKLLRNTLQDIALSGIVGETNNSLIAYLVYTSRKRKKPLHIMCLGASGTGKTYLQEKISELIPEEDKIEITSLSDNAFYYFGREELKHKLILIEDLDGAENVLYPLRELQSKRRISKTVTLKDNKGNLKTITLKVEGPVCVSGCTTRERIYEDNANRCILLYIDDSNEQDKRIMSYQQKASAGNINASEEYQITEKLKNVQRLLRPIKVVNPFAEIIDLPQEVFKPRRTLLLLLSFIETITFYHQLQREVKINPVTGQRYIESSSEDVKAGFSLMKEALFSKSDELTKASRIFLERLKTEVKSGELFYANQLRKKLRIPSRTLKRYLIQLTKNGYIKIMGGTKYRGFEYQICDYDEYKKLQKSIDDKLKEILSKIDEKNSPVAHQWPTKNGEPVKQLEIS